MCQDDLAVWDLEPYADFFFEAFLTIQKGWKFQLWVSTAEISCGTERYLSNQNYDSALFIVQWGLKLSWAKATDKVKYWDLLTLGLADFKIPKTQSPFARIQSQNQKILGYISIFEIPNLNPRIPKRNFKNHTYHYNPVFSWTMDGGSKPLFRLVINHGARSIIVPCKNWAQGSYFQSSQKTKSLY